MEKHFMIDIETTGIDPIKEDLLQIGVLEVDYDEAAGFWTPGRSFELIQHTNRKPESEFAKKHMAALYERCNVAAITWPSDVRGRLLHFFRECGANTPDVYLMGWNASNFDVPFLVHKNCLRPSEYETDAEGKDVRVGDFHYRIYEIGGAVSLAQNALGYSDRNALTEDALAAYPEIEMPEGKEHDAIYDCYRQLRLLNGLIRMTRERSQSEVSK